MKAIYIHSRFCPKCTIFKYGRLIRQTEHGIEDIHGDYPEISGLSIIKTVCESVGIPYAEIDVMQEYELPRSYILTNKGLIERSVVINPNRVWISSILNRKTIELPGFLVKSKITKSRYINPEIVTEAPREAPDAILITTWSAARQVLRAMARTAIEEKLIVHAGKINYNIVEYLLNKLFPIDENGNTIPDTWKWIEGFIKLRNMRIRL